MGKLPLFLRIFKLLLFINMLCQSASGRRTLGNSTPSPSLRHHHHHHHHHHRSHHKLMFVMRNVLNVTQPSSPQVTGTTNQLPFPKPIGLFPPINGIPIAGSNPPRFPSQTAAIPNSHGLFFPARNGLEFKELVTINEDLFNGSSDAALLGKAQGFCVAGSENESNHMIALNAFFADGTSDLMSEDGLRFFGVYRNDASESHVAVIGGTGKYAGANGYATCKIVGASGEEQGSNKLLLFNVYL